MNYETIWILTLLGSIIAVILVAIWDDKRNKKLLSETAAQTETPLAYAKIKTPLNWREELWAEYEDLNYQSRLADTQAEQWEIVRRRVEIIDELELNHKWEVDALVDPMTRPLIIDLSPAEVNRIIGVDEP